MERGLIYEPQRDWRCLKCNALLAKYRNTDTELLRAISMIEIRCRRCRAMNEIEFPEAKTTCLIS